MSTQHDTLGQPYHGNDPDKPAPSGAPVVLHTPQGPLPATMVSGVAVPKKTD